MVVEQIDNPANKHMHYGDKPPIGVINAPNKLPQKVVYSNAQANKIYNQMQYDLYQSEKYAKPPKKGKFPTILKILIGTVGITLGYIFRKDLGKLLKKVFKN